MTTRHDGRLGSTSVSGVPTDEPVFAELREAFAAIPTTSLEREHLAAMGAESRRRQERSRRWRRFVPGTLAEVPLGRTIAGTAAGVLAAVVLAVGAGTALGFGPWAPGPARIPASPYLPVASPTPGPISSSPSAADPDPSSTPKREPTSTATASDSEDGGPKAQQSTGGDTGKKTAPRPTARESEKDGGDEAEDGGDEAEEGGPSAEEPGDSGTEDAADG